MRLTGIEVRFLDSIRNRKRWNQFKKYVEEEFFASTETKLLFHALSELQGSSKKKEIPIEWLRNWVETNSPKKLARVDTVLAQMGKAVDDPVPLEIFIKRRLVEAALNRGIDLLAKHDGIEQIGIIRDMIDAAARVGHEPRKFYRYFDTTEERSQDIRPGCLPVRFAPTLTRSMKGGPANGEVCILIGPTGRGKSQWLCNVTADAILQGKNVLYVTLQDLPAVKVARRIDQILLGWTEKRILRKPETFKKRLRRFRSRCGELFIRDFTDQPASYLDLRACVETLKEEKKRVDLLVVDFLDPLVGYTKTQDPQGIFRESIAGMRRLGREARFPIWTASQGNRQSLDVEEVNLAHIAGPIAKVQTADWVAGMCQTQEMKDEGYFVLNELKTRMDGDLSKIVIGVDKTNFRLTGKGGSWDVRGRVEDQGVQERGEAPVRSGGDGDRGDGEGVREGAARGPQARVRLHAPRHAARRDPGDPLHLQPERQPDRGAEEVR